MAKITVITEHYQHFLADAGETLCPHCGADMRTAAQAYQEATDRRAKLITEVSRLVELAKAKAASPQA